MSVVARLVGGRVVPRLPMAGFTRRARRRSRRVALVAIAFAETTVALFAAILLFGATVGNILMLQPLLIAERFGVLDYPRIFSRAQFFTMFGVAGGPLLLGWLYDNAGGYRTSYLVAAGCSLAGALVLASGGPATVPRLRDRHPNVRRVVDAAAEAGLDDRAACASPTAPRRRPTPRRRSASTSARSSRA